MDSTDRTAVMNMLESERPGSGEKMIDEALRRLGFVKPPEGPGGTHHAPEWSGGTPEGSGGAHHAPEGSGGTPDYDSDYSQCLLQYDEKYQKRLRAPDTLQVSQGHGPEEHVLEDAGEEEQPLEDDETINRDTDEDHDEPAGRKEQPLEDDETINRDTDEDHDEPAGRKEQPLEDDDASIRYMDAGDDDDDDPDYPPVDSADFPPVDNEATFPLWI